MPKAADRAAQLKARMNQETQQRPAAPPIDDRAARAHFVGTTVLDQLTNGRTVQAIPVGQIAPELQEELRQPRLLPLPEELRPNGEWDETNQPLIDELLALGRSLQARQIQPIVVYPGTSNTYPAAQYLIAAGHRRWTAAVLHIVHQRCRAVDYRDTQLGAVHRDLRRAFKGLTMRYRTPTQLLRQPTMEGRDPTHPAKIAWNFFTGLYFKAGGTPWGPVGLTPGTCYVGIGFYNPLGSRFSTIQTSLAQAFDEYGEGLVLRGPDFEWDASKHRSRSPHLSGEQAQKLIEDVSQVTL